jgi:hypothetical protein
MGGAYRLAETTADLIEETIKTNIAQALANVRAERNDPVVSTEVPREYFQYETAQVYRAPAIFTIIKDQTPRDSVVNANHINAMTNVVVAVVLEDRLQRLLVKKAYRYQAALTQLLHQVTLTNADRSVKLFSRVQNFQFSGLINLKNDKAPDAVFRKEVSLKLQVEHIENLEIL